LTVYAADQSTVLGSATGLGQYGTTLTVSISGAAPGRQYYAVVTGADGTAFSTGRYALAFDFGSNPVPMASSSIVPALNGNPISGGGGIADGAGADDDLLDAVPAIIGISPDNGLSNNDAVTNVPNLYIQGVAPEGSTVAVYLDGQWIGTAVTGQALTPSVATGVAPPISSAPCTSATTWWFNNTGMTLPDGTYSFTATATDALGIVSALSFPLQVIINTQKPAAPLFSGVSPAAGATSAAAPTLFGTAVPNSLVTVYRDGQRAGTTYATTGGTWSFTSQTLAAGTYSFTATDTNQAGDVSDPSAPLKLAIGGRAPAVSTPILLNPILAGLLGSSRGLGSNGPGLIGLATPGTVVTIFDGTTVLGTATASAWGFWIFTCPPLGSGQHTLFAEATSASGVTGLPSAGVTITV
jgi:hypothetical protein